MPALAFAGLALLGAGCGSSGSESSASSKSPTELIEAAGNASKSAKSVKLNVHVTGAAATNIEILNVPNQGVEGKIDVKGRQAEFIVAGGTFYLKGGEQLFAGSGAPSGLTSELKGKWIKIPGADAQSGGLTQVGDLAGLLDKNISELKSSKSHLTKTGETTINGKKVVGLTGTSNGQKGTIFVEAAEPHYPVALEASEANGGNAKATFEDWNANAEVKAPANAVDLQSLLG
jgi:hypothetical protein